MVTESNFHLIAMLIAFITASNSASLYRLASIFYYTIVNFFAHPYGQATCVAPHFSRLWLTHFPLTTHGFLTYFIHFVYFDSTWYPTVPLFIIYLTFEITTCYPQPSCYWVMTNVLSTKWYSPCFITSDSTVVGSESFSHTRESLSADFPLSPKTCVLLKLSAPLSLDHTCLNTF